NHTSTQAADIDFDSLKGRVVLLDFWASWCGPCRKSFPWMQQMEDKYKSSGLTVIAVNLDSDPEMANEFLQTYEPSFRIEYDPEGVLKDMFGVRAMPTSFLINREGQVESRQMGFRTSQQDVYEEELHSLLNQKPTKPSQ
ncbi:MAG: TlpA family protein disulfide reductase, partial [Oceanobacter sp.]